MNVLLLLIAAAGDDLVAAVVCLANLAGQIIDGADGGFQAVAADAGFHIVQPAGDLVGQFEEGCIEGVDLGQFLLVDLDGIEEAGITVGGILDAVGRMCAVSGRSQSTSSRKSI